MASRRLRKQKQRRRGGTYCGGADRAATIIAEAQDRVQEILRDFQKTKQELKVFQSKVKVLLEAQVEILQELGEELE